MKKTVFPLFFWLYVLFHVCSIKAGEEILPKQDSYNWKPININGGGFVNFVTIDPRATNVVYAGVDVGGIYKSVDYGENWSPVNNGLIWPTDRLSAALTIDQNGSLYLGVGGHGKGGIFKSADNGESWKLLTRKVKFNGTAKSVLRTRGERLILIDPANAKHMYAGSYKDGIFKSIDGGITWKGIGLEGKRISSIVISPTKQKIIYVSSVMGKEEGENFQGGIYRNSDGEDHWERIGNGIIDVHQLVMDSTNHNIMYAACGDAGIFKTKDGGHTWVEKNEGLEGLVGVKFRLNTIKYISLAIDPENPEIIYAGAGKRNGQIYKSTNGGNLWTNSTGNKKNIYPDGWWVKKANWPGGAGYFANCLSIDPVNRKRIYVAGRSGLWRSDDGGITWHAKVKGLEATCMNQVAFDPKKPGVFFVGNTDWVCFRSLNGGKIFDRSLKGIGNWDVKEDQDTWKKYKVKNGLSFAFDPRHEPPIIYLGGGATGINRGTIFKSTDGGENWAKANSGLPIATITALAIDSGNYDILFAAVKERGLYITVNGGKYWERVPVENGASLFRGKDAAILIHPRNSKVVYILDKGNGVYKSIDGGKKWKVISENLPKIGIKGMDQFVGGIALDPVNPDTVYLGLRRYGVYKTVSGGERWEKITPDYMLHGGAISIDSYDGAIYLASVPGVGDEDIKGFIPGIYKSSDGGASWFPIHTRDLLTISLKITSLTTDPHNKGVLYLTTQGNGVIVGEPNVRR